MDGSQKLPQRLLGTIRDRLAGGLPITRTALGVAAWMRYVAGTDERGRLIDVRDPMAAEMRAIAERAKGSPGKLARGLLGLGEIFGNDLLRSDAFVELVIEHLASLFARGALATVRNVNRQVA
jgi:fructuronate reductase